MVRDSSCFSVYFRYRSLVGFCVKFSVFEGGWSEASAPQYYFRKGLEGGNERRITLASLPVDQSSSPSSSRSLL